MPLLNNVNAQPVWFGISTVNAIAQETLQLDKMVTVCHAQLQELGMPPQESVSAQMDKVIMLQQTAVDVDNKHHTSPMVAANHANCQEYGYNRLVNALAELVNNGMP